MAYLRKEDVMRNVLTNMSVGTYASCTVMAMTVNILHCSVLKNVKGT